MIQIVRKSPFCPRGNPVTEILSSKNYNFHDKKSFQWVGVSVPVQEKTKRLQKKFLPASLSVCKLRNESSLKNIITQV